MLANMCFTCRLPLMHRKKIQENYSDRQFWPIQCVFERAPTNTVFVYICFTSQRLFFGDKYIYTQLLALLGPWWLSWSSESGVGQTTTITPPHMLTPSSLSPPPWWPPQWLPPPWWPPQWLQSIWLTQGPPLEWMVEKNGNQYVQQNSHRMGLEGVLGLLKKITGNSY